MRGLATIGCLALMLAGCSVSDSAPVTTATADPPATSATPVETTSTSSASSTSAAVPATPGPTSTTEAVSHELGVLIAPADGQWFAELPIPWVFARWPAEHEDEEDFVIGALGWTRDEAVVTINGIPADQEWCTGCVAQPGRVLEWRASDRVADLSDWDVGANTLAISATFADGTVIEETRTFHYDPVLTVFSGWMVGLDEIGATITFAASTHEMGDEDAAITGPVTAVVEYPVRDDAAFVLLDVDSGGYPPSATIGFLEFADLVTRAHAGECKGCFFASWGEMFAPSDAGGASQYFLASIRDGEIQQLEQVWTP